MMGFLIPRLIAYIRCKYGQKIYILSINWTDYWVEQKVMGCPYTNHNFLTYTLKVRSPEVTFEQWEL